MKTEQINKIFKEYIDSKDSNALLINGKWGTGKTFFWKKEIVPIIKNRKLKDIYISLNGLSEIKQIEQELFLKLIPSISKNQKVNGTISTLTTNLLKGLSEKFVNIDANNLLKEISVSNSSFDDFIICFDDLERCNIPLNEVLGYVNNFVEHKNLKCLILTNEDEINSNEKENYFKIKEKLVFRTINFEIPVEEYIPLIFDKYSQEKDFYKFINSNKTYIKEIFTEYKENNLRTFSFYLNILFKLFPFYKEENEVLIKEILLFTCIISLQYKNGVLKSSDFQNFEDYEEIYPFYYSRELFKDLTGNKEEKDEEKQKTPQEVIYERYLQKRTDEYSFYSSIFSYILSGHLDEKLFRDEINEKNDKNYNSPEYQIYSLLVTHDFRSLENEDFQNSLQQLINYTKQGKYLLHEYCLIFRFLYYFLENDLIEISEKEIIENLNQGISIATLNKQIDERALDNLLHFKADTTKEEEIRKIILEAKKEIERENKSKNIEEILEKIFNGTLEYLDDQQKEYFLYNIINFANTDSILKIVKNSNNKSIRQLESLSRIDSKYYPFHLDQNIENRVSYLSKLIDEIQNHLKNNSKDKLNTFVIKEFLDLLINTNTKFEKLEI